MARVTAERVEQTKREILEAARTVLMNEGFSGLSTRRVADEAITQMSQIQYHFGSKEGMILALFEYMNEGLIQRQSQIFDNPDMRVSQKWAQACDFLEEDIASGYVRVLQELIAAGWSNDSIGDAVRAALAQWHSLLTSLVEEAFSLHGRLTPFTAESLSSLIAAAFIGAEALMLLEKDDRPHPVAKALRQVGEAIASLEASERQEI